MKLLKERFVPSPVPKKPFERSPRQCIGPLFTRPRSVCVVIGPFIGWNSLVPAPPLTLEPAAKDSLMFIGFEVTSPSGLPRSQASESKSPKT